MKRIIKSVAFVLLLFLLMACKEEEIMTEEDPYREGKILCGIFRCSDEE